jgi:transposase
LLTICRFTARDSKFKREEIQLSESTLNGWFTGGFKLIEPLYEHHKKQVQQTQYLMADETPIMEFQS